MRLFRFSINIASLTGLRKIPDLFFIFMWSAMSIENGMHIFLHSTADMSVHNVAINILFHWSKEVLFCSLCLDLVKS